MPKIARSGLDALIGQQLRVLRKRHGLKQSEFGAVMGVTGQQVHKIEVGENRLSIAQARLLAHRFTVSLDYFCPEPVTHRMQMGTKKRSATDVDTIMELVRTKAGLDLVVAFSKLKDERTRRSVAAFVKAMAQKETEKPASRARGRALNGTKI